VDETYVKVTGRWRYVYRAIDQFGQVIDVDVSRCRDANAARRFFDRAISTVKVIPVEVVTDRAATYPIVLEELLPAPWHRTERYANNRVDADHGRLTSRLRPMCGFKQDHSAKVVIAGHAFVQDLRRGHFELAVEERACWGQAQSNAAPRRPGCRLGAASSAATTSATRNRHQRLRLPALRAPATRRVVAQDEPHPAPDSATVTARSEPRRPHRPCPNLPKQQQSATVANRQQRSVAVVLDRRHRSGDGWPYRL
jgi:DDE domain